MNKSGSRSRTLLVSALLLSAGLGGVLGYLMRSPPGPLAPQALQITATSEVSNTDLRAALEPKLEQYIDDGADGSSAPAAALLRNLALAARRDPETASWLSARLRSPGVPEALLTNLLGELGSSRSGKALVREVLLDRLGSDSEPLQLQGLRIVRALGLGRMATSGRCACQGGLFPAETDVGGPLYLVAWALRDGAHIDWNPTRSAAEGTLWSLGLEVAAEDSGAASLVRRVDEASPQWTLALEVEGGPRIAVQALD